jgi:hypothetical protein
MISRKISAGSLTRGALPSPEKKSSTDLAAGLVTGRARASPPFGLIKIHTSILLTDVTRQGPHYLVMIGADRRSCICQTGKIFHDKRFGRQPFQGGQGADTDIPIVLPDIVHVRYPLYIDENRRALDPVLHIHQQVGSTRKNFGCRLFLQNVHGRLKIFWLKMFKFW